MSVRSLDDIRSLDDDRSHDDHHDFVSDERIEFILEGGDVSFNYRKSQLERVACRSTFICNLVSKSRTIIMSGIARSYDNFQGESKVDLSEFRASSFTFLIDSLFSGRIKRVSDELDIADLNRLIDYLGFDDEFVMLTSTSTERLFLLDLHPEDVIIRDHEKSLREVLFANEETDFRSEDRKYLFTAMCQSLGSEYHLSKGNPNGAMPDLSIPSSVIDEEAFRDMGPAGPSIASSESASVRSVASGDTQERTPMPSHYRDGRLYSSHCGLFRRRLCKLCLERRVDPPKVAAYGVTVCWKHKRAPHIIYDSEYDVVMRSITSDDGASIRRYPTIGRLRKISYAADRHHLFKRLFDKATRGVFADLDYTDLCVAGGSVYSILTGLFGGFNNSGKVDRGFTNHGSVNDFDFNLITKDPARAEAACKRVLTLFSRYAQNRNKRCLIVRTANAITMSITAPDSDGDGEDKFDLDSVFKIQIILRLYNSIAQVISGFDIDACTVAWDGRELYSMPRFVRCLQYGYNLVDPERQSANYHHRLLKYINRGVAMAIPGYRKERVASGIEYLQTPTRKFTGLSRVLMRWYKKHYQNIDQSDNGDNLHAVDLGDYGEDFRSTERTRMRVYVARFALKVRERRIREGLESRGSAKENDVLRTAIAVRPSSYLRIVGESLPIIVGYDIDSVFRGEVFIEDRSFVRPIHPEHPVQNYQQQQFFQLPLPYPFGHVGGFVPAPQFINGAPQGVQQQPAAQQQPQSVHEPIGALPVMLGDELPKVEYRHTNNNANMDRYRVRLYRESIGISPHYQIDPESIRDEERLHARMEENRECDLEFTSSLPPNLRDTFKTRNPGTQITNSFQPTFDDWYTDLYILQNDPEDGRCYRAWHPFESSVKDR